MLLELIGLLVLLGIAAKLLHLKYDHWRYSHLPGPPRTSFILGHALEYKNRVYADGSLGPYWLDLVREHGIIFQFWLIMTPRVFLADPLQLREIVSDFKTFRKVRMGRGFFDRNFYSCSLQKMGTTRFCGFNSILTDDGGPVWERKKKTMDPAFSTQRLETHLSKLYKISDSFCQAVQAAQEESPGNPIDVKTIMSPFNVDAISKAGFNATEDQLNKLRLHDNYGARLAPKYGHLNLSLVLDSEFRRKVLNLADGIEFNRKVGAEMILDRTSNGSFRLVGDLLDCIISSNMDEASGKLQLENAVDDFMSMYLAGSATTNTGMLWSLGELTRHPNVMEKLVDEIDRVWTGARIDSNTEPSVIGDTLKKMPYLDAFLKEVLRYHPPIQHINRTCFKHVELCGYSIPSHTALFSSQYVLHHWEKYWADPDKFEPDRFLQSAPKPYTFIPFFLGPRQCIGKNFAILELKSFLCELLKKFEVERDLDMPWKQRSFQSVMCFPIDNSYIFKPRF